MSEKLQVWRFFGKVNQYHVQKPSKNQVGSIMGWKRVLDCCRHIPGWQSLSLSTQEAEWKNGTFFQLWVFCKQCLKVGGATMDQFCDIPVNEHHDAKKHCCWIENENDGKTKRSEKEDCTCNFPFLLKDLGRLHMHATFLSCFVAWSEHWHWHFSIMDLSFFFSLWQKLLPFLIVLAHCCKRWDHE